MLCIDEARVRSLLRWEQLIPAMEDALAAFSRGDILQPVRSAITIDEGRRYLGIMPAVTRELMGVKAVSFYPVNEGSAVPTHDAMILLFRTDNGAPLGAMDGRAITEMRTAAVSAAITKYLMPAKSQRAGAARKRRASAHRTSRRSRTSTSSTKCGSGAARPSTLEDSRARTAPSRWKPKRRCAAPTSSWSRPTRSSPCCEGAWLKPGAHVNAVGANRPTWRELDDEAMQNVVVVDSREAVLKESGDVILSGATIYAEIGEIFAGTKPVP